MRCDRFSTLEPVGAIDRMVELYTLLGVTGDQVRQHMEHPALLEVFSGTGTMSKVAVAMGYSEGMTLDVCGDNDMEALCFQGDINDAAFRALVVQQVQDRHLRQGRLLMAHLSPPCQQYSRANTRGPRDLAAANALVEAGLQLVQQCGAACWMLENPLSGSSALWGQQQLVQDWDLSPVEVHYCQYGGVSRKATGIAFSCKELQQRFMPRTCPGAAACAAGITSLATGMRTHMPWGSISGAERMALPRQLCMALLDAGAQHSMHLARQLASALDQGACRRRRQRAAC